MPHDKPDTTPLTDDQWQALPAGARAERRRLGVLGAASVVDHPITPEEEDAARARCGGRPYYTLVEQDRETDLLCAVCHCMYWECQHADEISLAYHARQGGGHGPVAASGQPVRTSTYESALTIPPAPSPPALTGQADEPSLGIVSRYFSIV